MPAHLKDSHCSTCGALFDSADWPRTCPSCGAVAYRNPLPVAVALLPVEDELGAGLVVITRTIEPALGGIALPGGFMDFGEDWRESVVRELREETGIHAPACEVALADTLSSPAGHLLVFGLLPVRPTASLPASTPTDETTGWHVLRGPEQLAFPLHTRAAAAWFEGRYTHPA
ncbi:NUDIX domain-containing protein [Streptomyces sp. NBC_00335]|uniref:NUDIX domain-containing protein n=1 Tax=unclassified Streptomyces TaxID=2593676 RepID=UPI002255F779|nr:MULTISPECIES: NUDIX domain-containing protein [unclassified Streptomyces]MCX5408624.1 NUDIX domain-containing protein [Streptomyces sp. NBC_00086]